VWLSKNPSGMATIFRIASRWIFASTLNAARCDADSTIETGNSAFLFPAQD
jgi:hypothetical protein